MQSAHNYRIGRFRMDRVERRVLHEGRRVSLRGKAFELLELLASRAGQVVDKRAVLDALWPGVSVHDNNIAVTVRCLRKALEQHDPAVEYVETLPGRGYRLTHAALPIPAGVGAQQGAANSPSDRAPGEPGAAPHDEPFVARQAELARLLELWAAARRGSGQVVFVSGEPGIGKSRLVRRFVELARGEAPLALTLEGQCLQLLGAAEPHRPFLEALGGGLASAARPTLLEALELYAPAWFAGLPPGRRGSAASPNAGLARREPRLGPHELVDALGALSDGRPLLLVLEDVHWADASSVDDLRLLCERAPSHALLVVATYRPADVRRERHPLGSLLDELLGRLRQSEIAVPAWSASELRAYIEERFGAGVAAEAMVQLIWQRSEGLPSFAVRLTQSLVERGLLGAGPGSLLELSPSASLSALIRGHLERLGAAERHTLEAASVDGAEFGTALLSELLDRSAAEVEAALERLARAHGLLERLGEQELAGGLLDVRYRFRHVLYQNHLYAELGSHRALELHRRVAQVLLRANAAPAPSRVAFHLERGRDYSRAVVYWTEAGDQADRAYAKLEALGCYGRAASLLERLPESERLLRGLVLEHGRGWATLGLGRLDAAREHFLEFARLAKLLEATAEPAREAALALAREYFERPWSEAVLQRPADIFPKGAARPTQVELHAEALTCCCHVANVAERGDALYEHAQALRVLAEASGSQARRAEALFWLGAHALAAGRATDARVYLDEAISSSRRLAHGRALHHALGSRAWLDLMQGALERARVGYAEFLTLAPDASSAAQALSALGEAHAKLGQAGAALRFHEDADRLRQRIQPGFPSLHAGLWRELGQLDRARELDEAARSRLSAPEQRPLLASVLASLASTLCRQAELVAARAHVDAAESLMAIEQRQCSWRMRAIWSARCELHATQGELQRVQQLAAVWQRSALERGDAEGASVAARWRSVGFLQGGDAESARDCIDAALDATRATPMPLIDWRTHALLARVEQERGDLEAAAAARRSARQLIEAIARQLDEPERGRFEALGESELD